MDKQHNFAVRNREKKTSQTKAETGFFLENSHQTLVFKYGRERESKTYTCRSLLVLNAKDDLRADGLSFCFLISGIQGETPFSFLLSLFLSPLSLPCFLSLLFSLSFPVPVKIFTPKKSSKESPFFLLVLPASLTFFSCLFPFFLSLLHPAEEVYIA